MNEIKIINYYKSLIKVYSCSYSHSPLHHWLYLYTAPGVFDLTLVSTSPSPDSRSFPSSIAGIVVVGTQVICRTSRHRRVGLSAIGDAFLKSEIIHVVST